MTCREFERILPDIDEGSRTIEQHEHLRTCPLCRDLVSDLSAISRESRLLQSSEEPSPRVWNSIEIRLREEGLIGGAPRRAASVAALGQWRWIWLIPATAAAVVLVTFGVKQIAHRSPGTAKLNAPRTELTAVNTLAKEEPSLEDQQLLRTVALRSPAMRASYEANLEDVNSYIRDAEASTRSNPNDEQAQQSLMNAYEQRAMVYEMALDRSLP
jgi:hypothetical protein